MKNRWYSPTLGRFLTTDPIGENGGLNTQAYCHNDPINRVDPNGCYDWERLWYDVKKTFDVFDVLQPEDDPQVARTLKELRQRKLNDQPNPLLLAQTPIFLAPSASVCPAPLYPGQPTIGADPLTPAQRAEQQQRLRLEEMAAKEAQDIAIVNYYRTQDSVYAGYVFGVALAPRGIAPPAPSYSGGTFGGAPTVPGPILGGSPVSAPSTGAPFPTHSMRVRFVQTSVSAPQTFQLPTIWTPCCT